MAEKKKSAPVSTGHERREEKKKAIGAANAKNRRKFGWEAI